MSSATAAETSSPPRSEVLSYDMLRDLRRAIPFAYSAVGWRMPQGKTVVVLPPIVCLHLPRWPPHRPPLAGLRLPLLQKGAGPRSQWPQAEGAEGRPAGEAGVRGDVYDRGERLGRRAHFGPNHDRQDSGEYSLTLSIFHNVRPNLTLLALWDRYLYLLGDHHIHVSFFFFFLIKIWFVEEIELK